MESGEEERREEKKREDGEENRVVQKRILDRGDRVLYKLLTFNYGWLGILDL